jgi:hypothetical protein
VSARGDYYERYPQSILYGFSRIGGIIAILKVSLLLEWLHERWYKKQLSDTAEK